MSSASMSIRPNTRWCCRSREIADSGLDRTQPGLPIKRGRCGTMTHDYKRHGTTTLFAALDVLEGRVIGQCMARHCHQAFIRFLNKINRETPAGRELHLIVDNYATHKHPKVRAWLERHPRFHFHFTSTSASWLNAVEGFFAKLTRQQLKRGIFKGIVDLQAAINRYLTETNENPKPFTWTADPDANIDKVRRGKQALESVHRDAPKSKGATALWRGRVGTRVSTVPCVTIAAPWRHELARILWTAAAKRSRALSAVSLPMMIAAISSSTPKILIIRLML
jgi:transposase